MTNSIALGFEMENKMFDYNCKDNWTTFKLDHFYLDHVGLVSHTADLRHIPHLLLDQ